MARDESKKYHYHCEKCKFTYSRNSPSVLCPNCGSPDFIVKLNDTGAERLIDEVKRFG